jgi:hypothetical protein
MTHCAREFPATEGERRGARCESRRKSVVFLVSMHIKSCSGWKVPGADRGFDRIHDSR